MRRARSSCVALLFPFVLTACRSTPSTTAPNATAPQVTASQTAPELPSGWTTKATQYSERDMVAAANPLAVDSGVAMLAQCGSAVDAAIAVQMMLTLVEPQSSGIGSGAFLMHYDPV